MALDIISTINLDLKRPNTETVYAVQYDTAGRIKAQLTNDGEAWHVPSSAGGMVSFRKSDNIGGFYDTTELGEVAVSVDENDDSIIYIALDAQTTITATPLDHPVQMQINFYNSQGKRLSTFAFYLRVQESVLFEGDQDERPVASEWTFRILTGALGQTIKNQEDAIKWMADNIRTQAGYVVDDTLKVPGAAGDAKKIGELFEEIVKISDSMPGYFPTTDTARVGSTKYYTRSGTSPNYVYTEFTGATFATGVTYYEYSPWNRIWIDPDDNDVAIPTMDEFDEVKSAMDDIDDDINTINRFVDLDRSSNLFNYRTAKNNTRIKNDGTTEDNSSFWATDFIPIDSTKSTIYLSVIANGCAFYDSSKAFVAWADLWASSYSIQSTYKYARFNMSQSRITFDNRYTMMVSYIESETFAPYYIPATNTNAVNTLIDAKMDDSISHTIIDDISGYEEFGGNLIYDDTWYYRWSNDYKNIRIEMPSAFNSATLSITAGTVATRIAAVTVLNYAQGQSPTYCTDWPKSIEVPANTTFMGLVPTDARYIIVNTLSNNVSAVSSINIDIEDAGPLRVLKQNLTEFGIHFTVASHNIRDFNTETGGVDEGCPDNLVSTNLPLWKEHFSKTINADFLTIQEWFQYFDKNHTINAYDEILKQFYPYKYELGSGGQYTNRIILSKHKCTFTNLNVFANVGTQIPMLLTTINGKSVVVVCWLQSIADTAEQRAIYTKNAINYLSNFDCVIFAGDTNIASMSELETWTDEGYTAGNGGYWGDIQTCGTECIDNVIVKGAIMNGFEAKGEITSDHKAVISEIVI